MHPPYKYSLDRVKVGDESFQRCVCTQPTTADYLGASVILRPFTEHGMVRRAEYPPLLSIIIILPPSNLEQPVEQQETIWLWVKNVSRPLRIQKKKGSKNSAPLKHAGIC